MATTRHTAHFPPITAGTGRLAASVTAVDVGEALGAAAQRGDFVAFDEVLGGLEDLGRTAARAWYRRNRTLLARQAQEGFLQAHSLRTNQVVVQHLAAVALAPTPEQAAKWFGFTAWGRSENVRTDLVVGRMVANGADWCARFLDAACGLRFSGENDYDVRKVAVYGVPVLGWFGLPVPEHPTFARAWAMRLRFLVYAAMWDARQRQAPPAERVVPRDGWDPALVTSVVRGEDGAPQLRQVRAADLDLAEVLRQDPVLPDALSLAVRTPGALGALPPEVVEGWSVAEAVSELLHDGRLDRVRVVQDVLGALTRDDSAGTQKVLSSLLAAARFGPDDARDRVALLQGVVATARAAVVSVVLPALLPVVQDADELAELASTVFARKEKKAKTDLLRALTARDADQRFPRAGVERALRIATAVDDESLAQRARRALDGLGVAAPQPTTPAPPPDLLWAPAQTGPVPRPLVPVEPDAGSVTAAITATAVRPEPCSAAVLVDVFVRWGWLDADAVRRLLASPPTDTWGASDAVTVGTLWALGNLTRATFEQDVGETGRHYSGEPGPEPGRQWAVTSTPVTRAFELLLLREAMLAVGSVPMLLSTPTDESGALAFGVLVERLRVLAGTGCGELDLMQALLRLEPADPDRVRELDGLSVPVRPAVPTSAGWRRLLGRGAGGAADAVAIVAEWVGGGGLPTLECALQPEGPSVRSVELPVGLEAFPSVPRGLFLGHDPSVEKPWYFWGVAPESTVGVVPWWPELVAAKCAGAFDQTGKFPPRTLPWLAAAPGPAGPALHHLLALTMGHADEGMRLHAVDGVLTLVADARFDPTLFEDSCLRLLGEGELRLARWASAWEQAALGGGLAPLWGTLVRVVDRAAGAATKPAGLSDLLAMARRYAPSVPRCSAPPPSVVALASAPAGSKAALEARAWVAQHAGAGLPT